MFPVRKAEEQDRTAILAVAEDVGVFTPAEVACVDELLDVFLHQPDTHDYTFIVYCDDHDRPLGFACYGPTPLTEGTYDLYWLCVFRFAQDKGIASTLLERVEQALSAEGARLVVAETSGTPAYAAARTFYEHHGFLRGTSIPDFYRPGDDLIVYVKHLASRREPPPAARHMSKTSASHRD